MVREDADYVEAAVETVRNPSWGRSCVGSCTEVESDVQVGQGIIHCSHAYVWRSASKADQKLARDVEPWLPSTAQSRV